MNCEYVREYYGVPAEIGRRISFRDREGVIAEDRGNHIGVNFDDDKPNEIYSLHPTDDVKYLCMGKLRKMTQGQKRYQEYLKADWFGGGFTEWLGIK